MGPGKHRRTIPHSRDTNIPFFCTAPATSTYRAFSARVFHHQEQVIQLPGRRRSMHGKDKFLAEENILLSDEYQKTDILVTEGVSPIDETIKANNLSMETSDEGIGDTEITRVGPLTFETTPQLEDDERHQHVAIDDQAELM